MGRQETHPFQHQPDPWNLSDEQLIDLAAQVNLFSHEATEPVLLALLKACF
jgi:hypothetical protein